MLLAANLPVPITYSIKFSGERDASSIDLTFPDHVPEDVLNTVKFFFFYGNALFKWSPGAGQYSDQGGSLTTSITYNIGIQEQDQAELINKGHQLFIKWESEIDDLVDKITRITSDFEGEIVAESTFGEWALLLEGTGFSLSAYFKEPIDGRVRTIDDVMRNLREDFQTMLIVDPETDEFRLVCLLDTPSSPLEIVQTSLNRDFNYAHDPDEPMEVYVQDNPIPFRLPPGNTDKYARKIITQRLSEAEATLEITLQRLKEGASTRTASATIPAPHSVDGLKAILPGKSVSLGGRTFWITESTTDYPADTSTLNLYRTD